MAINTYRYLLADLLTNNILAELPFTGVSFTQQLNMAGTWQGRLLLAGMNSAAFNVSAATIPTRCALYVDLGGVLIWGGIIWGRDYNSVSQTLSISAREFPSYFERRRIISNQTFTAIDQLSIAQNLMSLAQSAPYGNIGIAVGTETSGVLVTRQYYSYEKKSYHDAFLDLSRAQNGFDFKISVAYNGSGVPTKTFTVGYPRIGTVYSSTNPYALAFALPANIIEYDYPEDGSIAANTIYALGAGSNEGKLSSIQSDATKTAAGFPLLEDTANYLDVTDQTYLNQLALGQVNAVSYPPTTMRVVIDADDPPSRTTYGVGDDARIIITDKRFPKTLDFVYRIVAITTVPGEDGPERVTLTLTTTTN